MEMNILKHSIFFEEIVYNEASEQSIDTDITLPDYCGPIKRILKCKAIPRLTSKGINGQNLLIDATVIFNFLYVDDCDCIKSYEHIIPINKNFELNNNYENSNISCKIKTDYINCRSITENKVSIHGSASINVVIKIKKQIELLSDIDNKTIEMLKDFSPATVPMGEGEKNLIIEEEISIGNGQASIDTLLRYDVSPIIEEFKIINNKVIAKGNLKVYILYSSQEGTRPHNFSVLLPFSQIIDIEGVNENCKCDCNAQVVFCELKKRVSEEECRSFLLTAKLLVTANAYCTSDVPVILDAYSTSCKVNAKKVDLPFNSIREGFNDRFIAKKLLEFSDGSIGSIIDVWCDCETSGYKLEGKTLFVSGRIIVQILAYDADGLPIYYERPIDFEYKYDTIESFNATDCRVNANISNSSFTIVSSNQLEVTVELKIMGSLYDTSVNTVITDIEISEDKLHKEEYDSGILIYFAKAGEKIWDIAKKYNSSKDEIMSINNCFEASLVENKSLIIPIK